MTLSRIADGVFHNGGSFANVGLPMGLILPYLERHFVGSHSFITHAGKLLRVRMVYYACGRFITRMDTNSTESYVKRLYECFKKLFRLYKF